MLRLLQTSDVHLGARHPILGERAALQRERQFAAFEHAMDLALATPVDLVLIADAPLVALIYITSHRRKLRM
jgi:DNA repair exonuclease SbcCD nuclease subunit